MDTSEQTSLIWLLPFRHSTEIKNKGHVVVRGECVISYADFEQFNIESEEEYANPRNLASGSLTLKDINEVKQRHLVWIPFISLHR